MPAKVSSSPFNSSNWYDAINNPISTGRGAGSYWDLGGWHYKRRRDWKKGGPRKEGIARMTKVKTANGKVTSIYKGEGYDDYMGFYSHNNGEDISNQMAYAEAAFSKDTHDNVIEETGCGHIAAIKWAQRHQVMLVTFADGSEVYFFRVPSAVFGTLRHFAQSKQLMPGSDVHHMLGHVFWELVRIKGQKHGARYPFEYKRHAVYQLTGDNGRFLIRLTKEMMQAIDPSRASNMREGEVVSSILTEDEWKQIPESVKDRALVEFGKLRHVEDNEGNLSEDIEDTKQYTNIDKIEFEASVKAVIEYSKKNNLPDEWKWSKIAELENEFKLKYGSDKTRPEPVITMSNGLLSDAEAKELSDIENRFKNYEEDRIKNAQAQAENAIREWRENNPESYAELEDKYRHESDLMRAVQHAAQVSGMYRGLWPEEAQLRSGKGKAIWKHAIAWDFKREYAEPRLEPDLEFFNNDKEAYRRYKELRRRRDRVKSVARRLNGRGWTASDLESQQDKFGFDHATAKLYKSLVNAQDWQGCLNFLKEHTQRMYQKTKYGEMKQVSALRYAGPNDFVTIDSEE